MIYFRENKMVHGWGTGLSHRISMDVDPVRIPEIEAPTSGTTPTATPNTPQGAPNQASGLLESVGKSAVEKVGKSALNKMWGTGAAKAGVSASGGIGAAGGAYQGPGMGAAVAKPGMLASAGNFLGMTAFGALASVVVSKLAQGFLGDKPKISLTGPAERGDLYFVREHGGGDGIPYETAHMKTELGFMSPNYKYRIGVEDTGQDPQVAQAMFDYFDSRFKAVEDTTGVDMNEILSRHNKWEGAGGRLDKGTSFDTVSDKLFSQVVGDILAEMYPETKTTKQREVVTGTEQRSMWDIKYPDKEAQYLGKGEYRQKPIGRGWAESPDSQTVNTPVRGQVDYTSSSLLDQYDTNYFKEQGGGDPWAGLLNFTQSNQGQSTPVARPDYNLNMPRPRR